MNINIVNRKNRNLSIWIRILVINIYWTYSPRPQSPGSAQAPRWGERAHVGPLRLGGPGAGKVGKLTGLATSSFRDLMLAAFGRTQHRGEGEWTGIATSSPRVSGSDRRFPQRHPLGMSSLRLELFGYSALIQQMPTNPLHECIMWSVAPNAQILLVAPILTACFSKGKPCQGAGTFSASALEGHNIIDSMGANLY